MSTNIVVVGGGAPCISFIYSFVKSKAYEKYEEPVITVVEKLKEFGPGNAYVDDLESNILNTKSEFITAIPDRPGHFYEWLTLNRDVWSKYYPNLTVDKSTYAPRSLFGLYMRDTFSDVCVIAESVGVKVVRVNSEAMDIKKTKGGNVITVYLSNGRSLSANKVILACGTQSRSAFGPPYSHSIINNPYPTSKLRNEIDKYDDVAIVGARLSAIDAVISLMESGHKGKISIHSRSGFFPYVRGTQGRYKNKYLNRSFILKNYEVITLSDLVCLYRMEHNNYLYENPEVANETVPVPYEPIDNLEGFIENEIEKSFSPRAWQAILYDTNSSIDLIWDRLVDSDKRDFFDLFYSKAISLRVSIPRENAYKILSYMKSGRVDFVSGKQFINVEDNKVNISVDGVSRVYDKAIYAVGSPRKISETDSLLLKNMLSGGLIREHEHGGIDVSSDSYGVFSSDGHISNDIYAVGEITSGKFLFTSAMDIIVRHAGNCASHIAENYSKAKSRASGKYYR